MHGLPRRVHDPRPGGYGSISPARSAVGSAHAAVCSTATGALSSPAAPIPAPRSATPRPVPATAPAMAGVAADDSGWWELDSSESIPAPAAVAVAGRRPAGVGAVAASAVPAATDWTKLDDSEAEELDAGPVGSGRPSASASGKDWVRPAAIAGGIVVGSIAFFLAFSLVSGALRSGSSGSSGSVAPGSPAGDSPIVQNDSDTPPAAKADDPDSAPAAKAAVATSPAASQHREAVDALIRAYNLIAEGYARIHDADSIAAGREQVARGAVQLRASAHRGRGLPALSPAERKALIGQAGPELLAAIDRVLAQLRRLREVQGIRSDFDRLIDAYTQSRHEIQRELDGA